MPRTDQEVLDRIDFLSKHPELLTPDCKELIDLAAEHDIYTIRMARAYLESVETLCPPGTTSTAAAAGRRRRRKTRRRKTYRQGRR
jgi:hypothetical protein